MGRRTYNGGSTVLNFSRGFRDDHDGASAADRREARRLQIERAEELAELERDERARNRSPSGDPAEAAAKPGLIPKSVVDKMKARKLAEAMKRRRRPHSIKARPLGK